MPQRAVAWRAPRPPACMGRWACGRERGEHPVSPCGRPRAPWARAFSRAGTHRARTGRAARSWIACVTRDEADGAAVRWVGGVSVRYLRVGVSPLAAPTGPRRAARGRERAAGRSEPSEQSEAILLTRRNHRTTGWRVGFLPSILPGHVQQGERVLWLPGLARLYDTQLYGRLSCVPPLAAPGTHRAGLARRCSAEQLNQQLARDPRA